MIVTSAVDTDLIEQFKNDIQQFDSVIRVSSDTGRAVKYTVERNDDGTPTPHRELGDIEDGVIKTDDYVISNLAGGGRVPGDKHAHRVGITAYCSECGDMPQKGNDDEGRCKDCAFGDNLLTADPGQTVIVEAGNDVWGTRHEPGDQVEATADEDGLVRGPEGVFNNGRYSIVDVVGGDA